MAAKLTFTALLLWVNQSQ